MKHTPLKKRGSAFKEGGPLTATRRSLKEARTSRPRRRAGRRTPTRPVIETLQDSPSGVREPDLRDLLRTMTQQRDAALAALDDRANVDLLMERYDRLLAQVEKGMQRLRKSLRVVVAVAEAPED
mgnify:CR=1 FL=1